MQDEMHIVYGIDIDGPMPDAEENSVWVPPTANPLNDDSLALLQTQIDPLRESNSFGIDIFLEVKEFVEQNM